MSEIKEPKNQNEKINETNENNKENQIELKEEKKQINPVSLLSKDLLDQINSLEEIDFREKKDNTNDQMQLDETQKESEVNEEEDEYILEVEKEMDKDFFGFEIFKNDDNEKSNETKTESQKQERFSNPITYPQKIMNFNTNQFDDSNFYSPIGRFSYDCPNYQNNNESFNGLFNNPYQNQLNFFNNSFTMNGKSGWVCSHCKNFNYEIRIKCNRCGRGNSNLFNQQNSCLNGNNFLSSESIANKRDINSSPILYNKKDFSLSPIHTNKTYYKEKGEKGNKKPNKCKKPFIERPGDWICCNCQNLNFAFRTNCNRCHLSKAENQKIMQQCGQH